MERPLRLRWEISEEILAVLRTDRRLLRLLPDVVDGLAAALSEQIGISDTDRRAVARMVDPLLKNAGLAAPQQKAVWDALAVRDPEAPVITNRKGETEPDPDLRDQENVPLPRNASRLRGGRQRAAADH